MGEPERKDRSVSDKYDQLTSIAGPVSRETFDRLLRFEQTFIRWSSRINLSGPDTLQDLWLRHILDSAQVVPLLRAPTTLVDFGTGGGFPGAILAILLRRETDVTLVESNRKKVAFLRQALLESGTRATLLDRRVDDVVTTTPAPDVITARALAPLRDLFDMAEPWLRGSTRALFHKGGGYKDEISHAAAKWSFDLIEHASATDPRGAILEVARLRRAGS